MISLNYCVIVFGCHRTVSSIDWRARLSVSSTRCGLVGGGGIVVCVLGSQQHDSSLRYQDLLMEDVRLSLMVA